MKTKPLPTSNQEAFNNVWQHFVVEKNPQAIEPGNETKCRYRIEIDGQTCGCAIGCQIPDSMYKPEFENQTIRTLITGIEGGVEKQISIPDVEIGILSNLQGWHDWNFNNIEYLKSIAKDYKLTIPTT